MPAPFRSCDRCSKPALVHNTVIVNGEMTEVHLCEAHAIAAGIPMPGPTPAPVKVLLGQLSTTAGAKPRGPICPECGHTFAEFRTSGLIGCAACYDAFAETLGPAIERAHGGATQHVGRTPPRAADAQQRAAVLQRLLKELEECVAAEQYERAARLRDSVRQLRPPMAGTESIAGGSSGTTGPSAGASA